MKNIGEIFTGIYINNLKEGNVKHPMITTYDVGLREMWSPDDVNKLIEVLNNLIKLIRGNNDMLVLVSQPKLKTLEYAKNVCDIHIKIWEENGVPLVMTKRPFQSLHSMIYNVVDDNYYKLYPML
ncbi:MAG: hypothetical protein D6752_06455 [Candidatus Nitrosothermus koennekii]|nr:MAG: hypothetical protein D6752_06455 [Candidatus Nitrosothermus koennekii]